MEKNYLRMQRHEQYACEKYRSELFQIEQVNGYPTFDMENVKEVVDKHKTAHKPRLPWSKKLTLDETPYKERLRKQAIERALAEFEKSFKATTATPQEIIEAIFKHLEIDTTPFPKENKKAEYVSLLGDTSPALLMQPLGLVIYELTNDSGHTALFTRSNQGVEMQKRAIEQSEEWEKAKVLADAFLNNGNLANGKVDVGADYQQVMEILEGGKTQ